MLLGYRPDPAAIGAATAPVKVKEAILPLLKEVAS
jgi:hypothetical protein